MKQIVSKVQTEVVHINEISDHSNIGIQWGDGSKAMVVRTLKGLVSINNTQSPNTLNTWEADSAKEYIERVERQTGNVIAFKFDTVKELYTWMGK